MDILVCGSPEKSTVLLQYRGYYGTVLLRYRVYYSTVLAQYRAYYGTVPVQYRAYYGTVPTTVQFYYSTVPNTVAPETGFPKHTLIKYRAPLLAQRFAAFSKAQYKDMFRCTQAPAIIYILVISHNICLSYNLGQQYGRTPLWWTAGSGHEAS
ncbi:hypothetical protein O988_07737 [Pseudogymnoascus sp. VKM F-3808]|nr:hypothetical protein O988_07737 [Pseudogymnoascus sp. VKM F-3808]